MKFTKDWLSDHLSTSKSEKQIIEKLNGIGLEVEKVEPVKNELSDFIVAKIIKANKHPNADRLKLCDVDIGTKETIKVVCGAPNAQDGLLTIYAPPGSTIPKNGMKLEVSKIRGETSYGMLCSEAELKLSNESEGIIALSQKYSDSIGEPYFKNKNNNNVIELSVTPNRPDCLGVRGIARDLYACGYGNLKEIKKIKFNKKSKHNFKIKIEKNKNQACSIFGSCLIKNISNRESPSWLKERILALGLRPISAVVDITNYVMFDLNRPLHAYDLDKIKNSITVRNSKKGEILKALDNKTYTLKENMCVISDDEGVLGLGGIIGGIRSGTELDTKNILIESAYFDPGITRKTSKELQINSDAKFRFERGIDPQSVKEGLEIAVKLITEICGGEISNFDIQETQKFKKKIIKFKSNLVSKTIGININEKNIIKILTRLGFETKKKNKLIEIQVPTWRPDIFGEIDLVEEIIRILGFDNINSIEPEKIRIKPTLNFYQKHFHLAQRSVASKGYYETITWSFSDDKVNDKFKEGLETIKIINPISSELSVLRNSLYPNLIYYMVKNLNRGFTDQSLFEIGPVFTGKKPGDQITVICGVRKKQYDDQNNFGEKNINVFDIKKDLIQSLIELGLERDEMLIEDISPSYYHPGISGTISSKNEKSLLAYFGQLHPKIINETFGFEIFLDNLVQFKQSNKKINKSLVLSDFQKSDRDFAFLISKNINAQQLVDAIKNTDTSMIKKINIFDVYEGENIPSDKKSIALKVTIQSDEKTLNDNELKDISNRIIKSVEEHTGAQLRS
ncbi:phenylalanine--tRNA ligase subunit beta [Candidatus Pelagibacter sp.]|nr:phenylalanine--tRNA ligase subunit beta [Candidatus Pelagibacter sp.]MDA9709253.1 phenylalanine--tRNA ligase subunit beta [Candidatus Pelagibacter sp.]